MSSAPSWPHPDLRVRTAILDLFYLLFVFVGVLQAGPPLSLFPIDLTVLSAGVVIVGLGGTLARGQDLHITRQSLSAQILLFSLLGWFALSLLWATSSMTGVSVSSNRFFGLVIGFGYPVCVIGDDRRRIVRLLWFIAVLGIGLAALFFLYRQVPPMVPNRISISRPIGLAIVILTVRALTAKTQSALVWSGVVLVLFCVLFQTGSRAPAAGAVITAVLTGGISLSARPGMTRTRLVGSAVATFGVVASTIVGLSKSAPRTLERFLLLLQGGGASIQYRLDFYAWAIDSWLTSLASVAIGQGAGTFAANYTGPVSPNYPHNIFIELVHAGGLVALALFVSFLVISVRGVASKSALSRPEHIAIVGMAFFMFINAQFTGNLYINKYLFASLGLLVLSNGIENSST